MPMKSNISEILFDKELYTYAIIDAAKIEELTTQLLIYEPEHLSLFIDEDFIELEEVAPYLIWLHEKDPFTQWVLDEVYGNDGAIFLQSSYDLEELSYHFGQYIYVTREVEHPDTKKIVIQEGVLAYYDPRVLPEWLESIDEEMKLSFLCVVKYCYYEDSKDKFILHAYTTKGKTETYHLPKESACI